MATEQPQLEAKSLFPSIEGETESKMKGRKRAGERGEKGVRKNSTAQERRRRERNKEVKMSRSKAGTEKRAEG